MNTSTELYRAFTDYLAVLYRLGERRIELPATAVRALRTLGRATAPAPPSAVSASSPRPPAGSPSSRAAVPPRAVPRTAEAPAAPPVPAPPPDIRLPEGPKAERLRVLAGLVAESAACRALFQRSRNMVFGVGDPDAALMFIGEAPGEEEDAQGEPFVGRAGQLLDKMIATMGLKREQVYIANICKFRPDMPPGSTGNRKPTPEEMAVCLPYLRAQIGVIAPQVIVALGATAVEGLFALPRAPIMKLRGTWMELEGRPVMPTYHPAYLLRNDSLAEKRKVWEDLLQVMERLQLPVTPKQRDYFKSKNG